jgi:predicted dehydrogenase
VSGATGANRQTVRVGLVGAGSWAQRAYVPALRAHPRAELIAVADPDRTRAEGAAGRTGEIAVFESSASMLAAIQPDLVCVVSPDDRHRNDADAALEAGAAVLCEKPLAVSVADAESLVAHAQVRTRPTRVGFTLRYAPSVQRLRALVLSGAIGEPRLLQAFQQNGQFLDPSRPAHWKMDVARTGGGAIVEYGVHTLDLARWIMGEVERVAAISSTWIPERPDAAGVGRVRIVADDSTAWLMTFATGALGVCHAGWATPGRAPGLELRVFGATGAVRCLLQDDLPGDEALWLAGPDGRFEPMEIPPPPDQEPGDGDGRHWSERWQARLLGDFIDEVAGARAADPEAPAFADGLRAQEILAAVVTATVEERWVSVQRAQDHA